MWAVFRRYVAKGYLAATGVLLLSLVIVISIAMMVEDVQMLNREDGSLWLFIQIMALRAMDYGYQLLPIAAFLGVLVWGAVAAKRGELTAAYVGGYSTWQIGRPLIGVAMVMALLTLFAGEIAIPWGTDRLVALRGLDSTARQQGGAVESWFKNGPYILYLPASSNDQGQLFDVSLYKIDEEGRINDWYTAAVLHYGIDEGLIHWELLNGQHFQVAVADGAISVTDFDTLNIPLTVKLDDLLDRSGRPSQLSIGELKESIAKRERTGRISRYHVYEYHHRLVYPLCLLVLVLISIPMALKPDKTRSISGALGSGTVVAGWAYGVSYFGHSMMSSGSVGPAAAAWGSLVVTFLGAVGAYLLLKKIFHV